MTYQYIHYSEKLEGVDQEIHRGLMSVFNYIPCSIFQKNFNKGVYQGIQRGLIMMFLIKYFLKIKKVDQEIQR